MLDRMIIANGIGQSSNGNSGYSVSQAVEDCGIPGVNNEGNDENGYPVNYNDHNEKENAYNNYWNYDLDKCAYMTTAVECVKNSCENDEASQNGNDSWMLSNFISTAEQQASYSCFS